MEGIVHNSPGQKRWLDIVYLTREGHLIASIRGRQYVFDNCPVQLCEECQSDLARGYNQYYVLKRIERICGKGVPIKNHRDFRGKKQEPEHPKYMSDTELDWLEHVYSRKIERVPGAIFETSAGVFRLVSYDETSGEWKVEMARRNPDEVHLTNEQIAAFDAAIAKKESTTTGTISVDDPNDLVVGIPESVALKVYFDENRPMFPFSVDVIVAGKVVCNISTSRFKLLDRPKSGFSYYLRVERRGVVVYQKLLYDTTPKQEFIEYLTRGMQLVVEQHS